MKIKTILIAGVFAFGATAAMAQTRATGQNDTNAQNTPASGGSTYVAPQGTAGNPNTGAGAGATTGAAGAANAADTNKRDAAQPGTGPTGSGSMGANPNKKDQEKTNN